MEFLLILIPLILFGIAWLIRRDQDTLRIGGVVVGICFGVITVWSFIARRGNFDDIEYLSYYITKIRHTDEWNEYIHRTCTREVPDGVDENGNTKYREEEYDCSYVDEHPERWILVQNDGSEIYTDEYEFEKIKRDWDSPEVFVDMHRPYYTKDGDAQDYYWDKTKTVYPMTYTHHYTNKTLGSESVLGFEEISDSDAKKEGLYQYPEVEGYSQKSVLGYPVDYPITRLNALYGKYKQIHIFVLVFHGKPETIAEDQKAYWKGGNKNELVICIGDKWAQVFSWQDDPSFDVRCRQYIMGMKKLDMEKLAGWIENNLGQWHRKSFSEFDYVPSYVTPGQMSGMLWTIIIISLIGCVILILNGLGIITFSSMNM